MIRKSTILTMILCGLTVVFINCNNDPLLTNMETNSLAVVIKGTYESNNPAPWAALDPDSAWMMDDSVVDYTAPTADVAPSFFGIDIAEMRLVDYRGDTHKFSNYRQGIVASIGDNGNIFFNGTGYLLQNDDVPSSTYVYLMLYVRKMVADGARKYLQDETGWQYVQDTQVNFMDVTVNGYNFNDQQISNYTDSLKYEGSYINRTFPLLIPISGGLLVRSGTTQVLEIRMVLKNFIKMYELETYDAGAFRIIHYYGPSDWLRDMKAGETRLGGNLNSIARAYTPGFTGSISGNNSGAAAMIIAVPAGSPITDYTRDTDPLKNRGHTCDMPQLPSSIGLYPDQYLDNYMRTETYLELWNKNITDGCTSFDRYQQLWNEYEENVGNFNVPPLAVYAAAGSNYVMTDVPPGSYDMYRANYDPSGTPATYYGKLFSDKAFGSKATVTVGSGANTVQNF